MTMRRHAVRINGITSSISLEDDFWEELKVLADVRDMPVSSIVTMLASGQPLNLSAAIRSEILHAKNREIANLQKMVATVAKLGLKDSTDEIVKAVRAKG